MFIYMLFYNLWHGVDHREELVDFCVDRRVGGGRSRTMSTRALPPPLLLRLRDPIFRITQPSQQRGEGNARVDVVLDHVPPLAVFPKLALPPLRSHSRAEGAVPRRRLGGDQARLGELPHLQGGGLLGKLLDLSTTKKIRKFHSTTFTICIYLFFLS